MLLQRFRFWRFISQNKPFVLFNNRRATNCGDFDDYHFCGNIFVSSCSIALETACNKIQSEHCKGGLSGACARERYCARLRYKNSIWKQCWIFEESEGFTFKHQVGSLPMATVEAMIRGFGPMEKMTHYCLLILQFVCIKTCITDRFSQNTITLGGKLCRWKY